MKVNLLLQNWVSLLEKKARWAESIFKDKDILSSRISAEKKDKVSENLNEDKKLKKEKKKQNITQ